MSDTILVPVTTVQPDLVTQTDVVVYVPLASKTSPGIVQIGEGLNIDNGIISVIPVDVPIKSISKNGTLIIPDENKNVNIILNKSDVGLSNVDNTSDLDKPISILTQQALNNLETTLTNNIVSVSEDLMFHAENTNNPHAVTKAQVGLSEVDNTSDKNKPISDATQTALNDKASLTKPNVFGPVLNTIPLISTSGILHNLPNGTTSSVILFDDDVPEIQIGNGLTNIKFYGKDSHITYNSHNIALDTDLNDKIDKSGGIFTGDVGVQGNLSVSGTITTKDTETLKVQDNVIVTNANKIDLLDLSGLAINKNDIQTYGIMYDVADDSVKLGLGSIDSAGKFTFNEGEGSPVATRSDSSLLTDNHLIKWDAINNKLVDSGYSADSFITLEHADDIYVPKKSNDTTRNATISNGRGNISISSNQGELLSSDGYHSSLLRSTPFRSTFGSYYDKEEEDTNDGTIYDITYSGNVSCENTSTSAIVNIISSKYDDFSGDTDSYNTNINMTHTNMSLGSYLNYGDTNPNPYKKTIKNAEININNNGVQINTLQGLLLTYNDSEVVNMNKLDSTSIRYDIEQTLTDVQKAQARANIGAGTGSGTGGGTTVTVGGVAQETWDADSKVNAKVGTSTISINESNITLGHQTSDQNTLISLQPSAMEIGHTKGDIVHKLLANENSIGIYDKVVVDGNTLQGIVNTFGGMAAIQASSNTAGGGIIVQPDKIEIETTKLTYNGNEVATISYIDNLILTTLNTAV